MTALLVVALLVTPQPPVAPPEPAVPPAWTAHLLYLQEWPDGPAARRSFTRLGAQRRIDRGAVIGEVVYARVRGAGSVGVTGEVYAPLWHNAEGYAIVGAAPGSAVLPERQLGAEFVQHVGAGWHVGAAAEERRYDLLRVRRALAVAGWQQGAWFVRARGGLVDAGEHMAAAHVIARRTLADRRSHLEVVASMGGDVVDVAGVEGDVRVTTTAASRSLALRSRLALSPRYAMIAGVGVSRFGVHGQRAHLEAGLSLSR